MGFYLKKSEIILDTNINKYVIPNYINTKTYERLYLKNPSTDKFVYLSQDPYHNGIGRFVRNPSCWINGVTNISCFSPAQLSDAAWNTRAGTLLTRKHVLFAKHYVPAIITGGTPLIFVDENNNVIRRNLIQIVNQPGADISIGLLDSEVPSNIKIAKVLPKNFSNYMATSNNPTETLFGIVGVGLDQEEKALTKTSTTIDNVYQKNIAFDNMSGPNGSVNPYSNWSEEIVVGDSGNPVFYIIDNELVVLTTWWTPTTGPFLPFFYDEVNSLIGSLSPGEGYATTPFDLAGLYSRLSIFKVKNNKLLRKITTTNI